MRNVQKIALASLLLGAAIFGISAFPETWVRGIGGMLSPRGAISDSFVPVFREAMIVLGGIGAAALLGAALWIRPLCRWSALLFRRIMFEAGDCARSLKIHLRHATPSEYAGIAILTAIGVGLRLWYLNQPMRFDEATTVTLYADMPWYIGLANYTMPNNHLLNTLLVRFCVVMGGDREWIIRLPALLAGLLCLPLAYIHARLMYSRGAALLALAWLSVSLPFVDMSTNARGYTMVVCCGLLAHVSIYCLLRKGYWIAAILNALAIGLGLMAVPVAVLFVGSGLLWAILLAGSLHRSGQGAPIRLRLLIGSFVAGLGVAGIGYAPMLIVLGPKWLLANEWVRPLGWSTFIRQLPGELWSYGRYNSLHLPHAAVAMLALSGVFYLLFWRRIERTKISLPFLLAGVCLVALVLKRRYPLWGLSPMWMFLSVVSGCAIAAGFARLAAMALGPRFALPFIWLAAISLSGIGACGMIRANPRQTLDPTGGYSFSDARQVARYLADHASPRDEILLDNAMIVHQYYARRCGAGHLNWSWKGSGPRRIFVLETSNPNPYFSKAMWKHLKDLGFKTTNDLSMAAEFENHKVWVADVEP